MVVVGVGIFPHEDFFFFWNIRGSGSPSKMRAIKEAICKANPNIVVLQETKKEEVNRCVL